MISNFSYGGRTIFRNSPASPLHMNLSLILEMQMLPNAPRGIMRTLDLVDRPWCAGPIARWGSGFAVDAA